MGGWGKLVVTSIVLNLDGLPVPSASVDKFALQGLFSRGECIGNNEI